MNRHEETRPTSENAISDALPGRVLSATDCLPAAGHVWPIPQPTTDPAAGHLGIHAGSSQHPGAAFLALRAAVASTAPLVHYAGPIDSAHVGLAVPEVSCTATPQGTDPVRCWVTGPGIDPGSETATTDLLYLLRCRERLLLESGAVRIIASHPQLRSELVQRGPTAHATILTLTTADFAALATALGSPEMAEAADVHHPLEQRRRACAWLAGYLHSTVVITGRLTIVSDGTAAWGIDAEHSWGLAAGAEHVLSGLTGAVLAAIDPNEPILHGVIGAVAVHAVAALRAARTEAGDAPLTASDLLQNIRPAIALALTQAEEMSHD